MKVKDLIKLLETQDPELEVLHEDTAGRIYTDEGKITQMYLINTITKETKHIMQDWCRVHYRSGEENNRYRFEDTGKRGILIY